jgi:glycosyltransferase involved in cell wall biosynthesis
MKNIQISVEHSKSVVHPRRELVTIGIPTCNRVTQFERALASAMAQSYQNVEIVISDNASTDGTKALCAQVAAADSRVRVLRQATNIGAAPNFRAVLEAATGAYFMWLADDDWIEPTYVSECAGFLAAHADYAIVAGQTMYFSDAGPSDRESPLIFIEDELPEQRAFSFYNAINDCSAFYGIARRQTLLSTRFDHVVGSDVHMVASVAVTGKIATLTSTTIHRDSGGASRDLASFVTFHGLKGRDAQNPFGVVTRDTVPAILWRLRPYRSLSLVSRLRLATRVYLAMYERFCMWDATQPSIPRRVSLKLHRWALARGAR